MVNIETVILQYLIHNKDYFEIIIPYLDEKLFESIPHKHIVKIVKKYFQDEEIRIPYDILGIRINDLENISAQTISDIQSIYSQLTKPENIDIDGIVKETEKYFRQRKIWNVISNGIEEYDRTKDFTTEFISQAEDAISYSFDDSVGYDYLKRIDERFESYKEDIVKTPISIDTMNDLTNGGIEKKTLNVVISSTGGGKTVWLCQEAAHNLQTGKNVLYITLEISEEKIAKRIDSYLLDIRQDKLKDISNESRRFNFKRLQNKNIGELIIKEFPADSITSLDIKKVITQIKRKRKIDIDVLIVDYLGIMGSYRYSTKMNNSYAIGKHAAEELRSLAVQFNIPIWTAIQFNRGAENPEDAKKLGMNNVSDSYGIPMGVDLMFAILHTDELDKQNRSIFKILKNRYSDKKNESGIFTVLHDWNCSKFKNDPDAIKIQFKDDSNTEVGKKANEKLKNKNESNIIEENNNVLGGNNNDLF